LFRAAEFERVKKEGRSVHGRLMLLGVLKGLGEERARVGIITSRKVGSAVVRNGVRRRIREIVRHARPKMRAGVWMVIIAKSAGARAVYAQLRDEWTQLARKAGCLEE
jgi:ribonuclease P protein component